MDDSNGKCSICQPGRINVNRPFIAAFAPCIGDNEDKGSCIVKKVVYIILDGLCAETAFRMMGFMEHMVEQGTAEKYTVQSELPTLSRPLYEVLMTGVPVYEHETFNNEIRRLSKEQSIFSLARQKGLVTAAAAYHWMSELYNRSPFNPVTDRFQLDVDRPIQHGIFYFEDLYPDSHLFCDAAFLCEAYNPDFLLVHSMNIDDAGHKFGYGSKEYDFAAAKADMILSMCVKRWIEAGFAVVVTADHGMAANHIHNGTSETERRVPLYIAGIKTTAALPASGLVPQLALAPFICGLLGLEKSEKMLETQVLRYTGA